MDAKKQIIAAATVAGILFFSGRPAHASFQYSFTGAAFGSSAVAPYCSSTDSLTGSITVPIALGPSNYVDYSLTPLAQLPQFSFSACGETFANDTISVYVDPTGSQPTTIALGDNFALQTDASGNISYWLIDFSKATAPLPGMMLSYMGTDPTGDVIDAPGGINGDQIVAQTSTAGTWVGAPLVAPEPGILSLLLAGLAGMAALRVRRQAWGRETACVRVS